MKHANKRVLTSDWLAERIEREESFIDDPVRQCAELELCRDDPVHFINNWGWTYDPRNIFRGLPVNIPFILYPRQAELLRWFHERVMAQEDCQIEKSREEGVTWLISVAYGVWGFTFHDGFAVGVGSRKLILVDRKDDMSAIFPKSLFMINRLPPWMKPKIAPAFCNIRNLDNGSTITGEAGDEIGRGGRTTFTVIDEAAFVQHPIISDTALLGVGSPICWMSTPNGSNNPFAQRHRAGATNTFRIHFRDNPFKDAAWEAETRAKMSPAMFAQEHDISFTASIERVVIPSDWVTAAINLDLTATSQVVAGLDIGDSGMDMNVLVFRRGGKIIDLVAWDGDGNPNNTAHRAIQECTSRNVKILHYDRVGVGASVAGPLMSAERLSFRFIPVLGGARPTDTRYADALTSRGRTGSATTERRCGGRCVCGSCGRSST